MRRTFTFAAISLGLVAAPALAQDEWTRQVQNLIESAAESFADDGFDYGTFTLGGALNDGERARATVLVSSNVDTRLVGVCDTDCSDIDLILYDQNGKEVDRDVLDDDVPIVSIRAPRNGLYTVEVIMADCDTNPCRYGVAQFVK